MRPCINGVVKNYVSGSLRIDNEWKNIVQIYVGVDGVYVSTLSEAPKMYTWADLKLLTWGEVKTKTWFELFRYQPMQDGEWIPKCGDYISGQEFYL